ATHHNEHRGFEQVQKSVGQHRQNSAGWLGESDYKEPGENVGEGRTGADCYRQRDKKRPWQHVAAEQDARRKKIDDCGPKEVETSELQENRITSCARI